MTRVHLDKAALARAIARGDAAAKAAGQIADHVRAQRIKVGDVDGGRNEIDLPLKVYDNDDGTATVVLAHPAGIAVQAKHGALTRAAAANGMEVRQ